MQLDLVDDPEAVRTAVGASVIDVTDPIVQSLMIAYLAEVKLKAKVPYWASLLDGTRYISDPDTTKTETQTVRLRAAATYYAAGLLCRRLESGAIPLVAGGNLIPVDWKAKASEMFAMYGALLGELIASDPTGAAAEASLPIASFSMKHSRRRRGEDWMTDPPIAHILHPFPGEDWG